MQVSGGGRCGAGDRDCLLYCTCLSLSLRLALSHARVHVSRLVSRTGKRTISKHMQAANDHIGLVVGGEKEALLTRNGREAVVLGGRSGFISLALKYGYHLVPSYAFGQNELYYVPETTLGGLQVPHTT